MMTLSPEPSLVRATDADVAPWRAATRTTTFRGVYADRSDLRGEFFDVAGLRRGER